MLTGNSKLMNGMHENDKRSTSCVQSKSYSNKRSKLSDLIDDYMSTNVLNKIQPKDYTKRDQDTRIDLDANEVFNFVMNENDYENKSQFYNDKSILKILSKLIIYLKHFVEQDDIVLSEKPNMNDIDTTKHWLNELRATSQYLQI